MPSYQYVYVMKNLTKAFPGGREVFKGITLSFLPGVKIGVLGVNGAGKSTLLKIMAGIETEFGGEAWAAEGARVGYLPQEPQLDPDKTVAENVAEAFGPLHDAIERFNEISARFAEPMDDDEMNALLAEQAELQEKIDHEDGWELDRRIEIALDALRCPPPDSPVTNLSGGERRRVALCRLLLEKPDLLLLDEPTNHLDAEMRRVAGKDAARLRRHRAGRHPRPLFPGKRHQLDPRNRARPRLPVRGQLFFVAGPEAKRLPQEEKEETARMRALAAEQEWIGSSPRARQTKNKARIQKYEEMLQKSQEQVAGHRRDRHPAGPAARRHRHRGGGAAQGVRQPAADRGFELQAAARRHRRRDRPERRRQDHPVPHDHRPGTPRRRQAHASARR